MTLKTENAPPQLKPPPDLKIPDLIASGATPAPPAAHFSPPPAPQAAPKADAEAARNRNKEPNDAFAHKPEIPRPATASLKLPQAPKVDAPVKPAAPPPPPPLKLAAKLSDLPTPHLEIPPPPPPAKSVAPVTEAAPPPPPKAPVEPARVAPAAAPAPSPGNRPESAAAGDSPASAADPKIMALSVDPVPAKDVSAVPAGNRAGAFSISPAGGAPGVPGGVPGAPPEVGKGGPGPGGEKTAPAGNASADGGGGPSGSGMNSTANPGVSISGPGGAAGISAGTLAPLKAEDLVYAVTPDTPKAKAPNMIVSSGSWGGGGLRLFGVLHGNRIYTVYFPMPGKSWILQYCAQTSPAHIDTSSRVVQIHFDPPLTPPAAIEQFDFHRPTSPPDAANSMIILHGTIREDGSVGDLAALQSYDPVSSAASRAAFSRWKFKPALRAGVPVALEILVGIP
jgi:hypothetical protein